MKLKCATQQEASTDSTAGNQKPVPRDSFGKTKNQKLKMPGQLKEVRNRIKSVQSSQQITKAMKMVSAAKLRRAQDAIIQMRPYAKKLQEMLSNIVSSSEGDSSMSLAADRPVEKAVSYTHL